MNKTTIKWVNGPDGEPGYTWNPITGCSPVSVGCDHCYAARIATRFAGTKAYPNGFKVTLHPEKLNEPVRKKEPARIFVCSMADIFHPDVPDDFIAKIFWKMKVCPQHTFFVLTKRPERMLGKDWATCHGGAIVDDKFVSNWYADNIWVGVSAENQKVANQRIPFLVALPVAHRFVSCEPLIGPVNLEKWLTCQQTSESCKSRDMYPDYCGMDIKPCLMQNRLEWVIAGGETGPGARQCEFNWIDDLLNICEESDTAFFFKQWGDFDDKGCRNAIIHGGEYHFYPENQHKSKR